MLRHVKAAMFVSPRPLSKQAGMMLLEGLIAILVFSLGILALVGMQATAVKQVTDAKYRSEASLLVDQLIGKMWVSSSRKDAALLKAKYDTATSTDTDLVSWKAAVAAALPGITAATQPTVNVTSIGTADDGTVTITVYWKVPGEASSNAAHKYVTIAQIR